MIYATLVNAQTDTHPTYTYTPLLSTVVAHTLLNTTHTVGSDCGYNPG